MYYKVVNNDLSSAYIGSNYFFSNQEDLVVFYKINEWVYPRLSGSQLMVFNSYANARNYMLSYNLGNNIFKCEVLKPSKRGIFFQKDIRNSLLNVLKLKKNKKKYLDLISNQFPDGTVFCEGVKLLNKLY